MTERIISPFFTFSPGANIFYLIDGTIIPYAIVWKCVSHGINTNLNELTKTSKRIRFLKNEFIPSPETMELLLSAQGTTNKGLVNSGYYSRSEKLKVFTVVREPLTRFISGVTESIYRTFKNGFHYEADGKTMKKTNATAIARYLRDVLDFRSPLLLMGHFYPISGVLFKYHIHHLGHLESFNSDWERVIKPAYNLTAQYREDLGMHETSVHHPAGELSNLTYRGNIIDYLIDSSKKE